MCTHILNDGIFDEYVKIQKSGKDTILLIDNTKKLIDPQKGKINKFKYDDYEIYYCLFYEEDIRVLHLPFCSANRINTPLATVLWYNCDYFFPLIKHFFPGYNYYWRFEYDCFYNDNDYKSFFINYENNNCDLISENIRTPESNWYYNRHIDWIYPDKDQRLRTFFPTVRLSQKAVDLIFMRRQEVFEEYKHLNRENCWWPECEIFVPTEINNAHLTWYSLNNLGIYRFSPPIDLNICRIFIRHDRKLYHPVKDLLSPLKLAEEEIKRLKTLK